ncbi:histone-lysine N-methyltransferase PRDM9 [Caerostris extrusa]|uniref:Histone-lysine N-methyltransferase PRDM9 n=1 Tax=Caerostris extrusa TaxID=172846 RepID=A0AAV4Q1H2_CAEEX|nr:histone-lysine N-methyltransferase PRDM9 [Caerostris extrusa]
MRYVNCADSEEWQNVVAFQYKSAIYYRTYKPVLPYTEILVWYGNEYASHLDIDVRQKKLFPLPKEISGFQCEVCEALFSSEDALQKHRKKHPCQRHKRHRCPECSYATDRTGNLRQHLLTHRREAARLRPVPQEILPRGQSPQEPPLAHGREEARVRHLRKEIHSRSAPEETREDAQRREALPMIRLREGLLSDI